MPFDGAKFLESVRETIKKCRDCWGSHNVMDGAGKSVPCPTCGETAQHLAQYDFELAEHNASVANGENAQVSN